MAVALDSIGNNVAASSEYVKKCRAEVFKLRFDVGEFLKRVKPCGRYPVGTKQAQAMGISSDKKQFEIDVARGESGRLFYSGLQSCKSVWVCPVCSMKISSGRAKEVRDILQNAQSAGYKTEFLTLTMSHKKFMTCKNLKEIVANNWRFISRHRQYKKLKNEKDLHFIRALEITHGVNGWHPHLHVAVVSRIALTEVEKENLKVLWIAGVRMAGHSATCKNQKFEEIFNGDGIGNYISKWDVSKELTEGHTKKGGNTPFQLFRQFQETGDEEFLNLFREFSRAFNGARQLTFSRGLKEKFQTVAEKSDEELVKDESIEEIIMTIAHRKYMQMVKSRITHKLIEKLENKEPLNEVEKWVEDL